MTPPGNTSGGVIPRVLHRIWLGGPMPEVYDHGEAWESTQPGWVLRLWTEQDLDASWTVKPLLDQATRFAPTDSTRWRVDVWRLEILHRYGGVYVDCDVRPLRSLDPLCDREGFVAETPNLVGTATNAVMGFTPRHSYVTDLLEGLADRAERYAGRRVVESVGGKYLTETLAHHPTVDLLPWWWFASQSIASRRRGVPPDTRNIAEGFVDHEYRNSQSRSVPHRRRTTRRR